MSLGFVLTRCLAARSSVSPGKKEVARLLYGKRRNLPHTYSAAKPNVIDTLLATSSSFSPPLAGAVSSQDLRTSLSSFVRGLQRAFTMGELGRGEVLSLLQKNRKMNRLDYSRAVWEWCTTPVVEKEEKDLPFLRHGNEDTEGKGGAFSRPFLLPSPVLPPQASLWTSAHDVVLISHINDIGSSYIPLTARVGEDTSRIASKTKQPHTSAAVDFAVSTIPSLSFVQQVFQRAIQFGRGNHRALLGGLLTAYSRQEDWRGALRAYQSHVFRDGKLSDSFHLHIVMNVCRRCGAWEEGIALFQQAVTGKRETGAIERRNRRQHSRPKGPMTKEAKPSAEGDLSSTTSSTSSSSFPAAVPVVPAPNAVVYLELLRLISQSDWPHRYASAKAVVDALHHHSHTGGSPLPLVSSRPNESDTSADLKASVVEGSHAMQHSPPPPPPLSAPHEEDGDAPLVDTDTHTHGYSSTGASLPSPFTAIGKSGEGEPHCPIRLTAGHYNAVLAALKPQHIHHREASRRGLFLLYDQLLPRFFSPSFSLSSSWQEEEEVKQEKKQRRTPRRRVGEEGEASSPPTHSSPPTTTTTDIPCGEEKIPFFLSPPYAPRHVAEGWRWLARMKARHVAPSPETLPTLLSLHPRHLLHVLSCIEECHRLALPVTAEMYRAALLCFLSPSYLEYIDEKMRKEIDAGWPPEKTGRRLQDAIWFATAEYQRLEAFEATPAKAEEEEDDDEDAMETRAGYAVKAKGTAAWSDVHSPSSTPDVLGLHLSTALVDVLLAHPRPSEAQYWLTLFAARLRPVLSALTFGVSDRLGVETTADLFGPSPSRPLLLPGGKKNGADSGDVPPSMTVSPTAPTSSSFFWQVHGRVAVVDHNVLLSPLFESLSYHYDAAFIPFSSLRVLVRRLKSFRANSKPAKYTRRALRLLRERLIASAFTQGRGKGGRSASSVPLPLYVIPLAHQLYAHRYLEGLSPLSSPGDGRAGKEKEEEERKRILHRPAGEGKVLTAHETTRTASSSVSSSLSEKLLHALQDTTSSNASSPAGSSGAIALQARSSLSLPSVAALSPPTRPLPPQTPIHRPNERQEEASGEGTRWMPPADGVSRREMSASHLQTSPTVPPTFTLHRPHTALTMPERVLAVACMLKTLNPEASVHVLSSSSFLATAAWQRRSKRIAGSDTKEKTGMGTDGRAGRMPTRSSSEDACVEDTLPPPTNGRESVGTRKEERSTSTFSSALEEAVHRWNDFQRRKAHAESRSFRHDTRDEENHEEEETPHDDVVPQTPGALFLTHVYHPTELAEKAPSELQFPSSRG